MNSSITPCSASGDRCSGGMATKLLSVWSSISTHPLLHAAHLAFDRIVAIGARAQFQRGGDARRAHFMHAMMTALDRVQDRVPFPFDIVAVCVQLMFESEAFENALARGDISRQRQLDRDRNEAKFDDDFHGGTSRDAWRGNSGLIILTAL